MISETTKLVIDTMNKWMPNNPEDYVIVLCKKTYEELKSDKDQMVFTDRSDYESFPERMCGMDVFVDNRIPPEVAGYIMPRKDYERAKEQFDEMESNPFFFLDSNN